MDHGRDCSHAHTDCSVAGPSVQTSDSEAVGELLVAAAERGHQAFQVTDPKAWPCPACGNPCGDRQEERAEAEAATAPSNSAVAEGWPGRVGTA
jgi:hypothetical protein